MPKEFCDPYTSRNLLLPDFPQPPLSGHRTHSSRSSLKLEKKRILTEHGNVLAPKVGTADGGDFPRAVTETSLSMRGREPGLQGNSEEWALNSVYQCQENSSQSLQRHGFLVLLLRNFSSSPFYVIKTQGVLHHPLARDGRKKGMPKSPLLSISGSTSKRVWNLLDSGLSN